MKSPFTLDRTPAPTAVPPPGRHERRRPAPRSRTGHRGIPAGPANAAARRLIPPAAPRPLRALLPGEAAAAAGPDEELVPDLRAGLTPAQVIDGRLLALLGGGNPGLYVQAAGRPGDVRRQTGR